MSAALKALPAERDESLAQTLLANMATAMHRYVDDDVRERFAPRVEALASERGELPLPSHRSGATSDTEVLTTLLASHPDLSIEEAAILELPKVRGAFSLVFMDEHTLYAARDSHGVRPLVIGKLDKGWVIASETAALDIVGASFVREVEPGEFIAIDASGLRSKPKSEGLRS